MSGGTCARIRRVPHRRAVHDRGGPRSGAARVARGLCRHDAHETREPGCRPMLVKICGITRMMDAEAAIDAGAGALGFVFWPESPRFIDPYRARAIVAALPPFVTAV